MWMAAMAIVTAALGADGQILGALENGAPSAEMMTHYLRGKMQDAFAQRAEALEQDLETPESILARGQRMREFFVQQLGGWPEKTPLNPRVVENGERDGYRYEKVIFESRPNFFVTAVMYLPMSEGPYPGVLVPCGHDANGKAAEAYQRAAIFLAHNGIAAMIYDPIGQGERSQLLDADGKQKYGSTIEHTMVTVGSIPLGMNVAGYRIWDGIRGIDYLCSRDDIDPERIGCTGNSGGGTLTSYIMALDKRVLCAAPSCYITSLKNLITIDGPHDGEQNIAGALAFGMDHADFLLMRAPRPTLICCATRDFFPIAGVWDSYRVAKRAYTKLGFEERVNLAEADEEHGYTPLLRQAMVRWMLRWLKGIDEPVVEGEFDVLTDAEVQVTPQGQVLLLEGARSLFDINADIDAQLAEARKAAPKDGLIAQVRDVTGIRTLEELPEPEVIATYESKEDGYTVRHVVLTPEFEIQLPAIVYLPEASNGEAMLAVANGKADLDADALAQLARSGYVVVAADLRGLGETTSNWTHGEGWDNAFGPGYKATSLAYLLDRSILSMRAEDVLVCARFAATYENSGVARKVVLSAQDVAGPPALHAAALEPDLFSNVRLERALQSWSSVVRTPETKRQYENVVHGVLRVYDLPDLVESLGDKIEVNNPSDAAGKVVE
jgi:cephalosporin-C deacetylase-like acetyl esterase